MEIFLLFAGIFLFTFFIGILLEKIRIPWIFASLILGLVLAFDNPFSELTSSGTFKFLAWLGMYFLLFLIGFELDLEKIKRLGGFIVKSTFFIILFEAFFGSLLIHFVFGYSWFLSVLIALSFATVGEVVLIPILDEFKLTKTKLGQTILGIGVLDDIIEIFVILIAVLAIPILVGGGLRLDFEIRYSLAVFLSLFFLFLFVLLLIKVKRKLNLNRIRGIEIFFLFILAIFFLFIGLASYAEAAAIGAILAGIVVKNLLPKQYISLLESRIKTVTYALFGPIFFFWVGLDADIDYLIKYPLLIVLVIVVAKSAKIFASWLIGRKELGLKPSILMGIALGVRFSSSIVIIKFLFEKALIRSELYSVLIASTIAFKFIIPFLLSCLIKKWQRGFSKIN